MAYIHAVCFKSLDILFMNEDCESVMDIQINGRTMVNITKYTAEYYKPKVSEGEKQSETLVKKCIRNHSLYFQ